MGIFITVTIVHYPIILAVWNTDDDRYSNFAKIRVVIIVITHNASRTVSSTTIIGTMVNLLSFVFRTVLGDCAK